MIGKRWIAVQVRFADGATEEYEDTAKWGGAQSDTFRPQRRGGYVHGAQPQPAIKLYKYDPADLVTPRNLLDHIQKLVEVYNPTRYDRYWSEFFAWPDKLVVAPRVGFRMPWAHGMRRIDDYFYDFPTYWNDVQPGHGQGGWFIGRLAVALKLSLAMDRLATMGLCYADFSHRNVMVDLFEGRMMLIDCDALIIPDELPPHVWGTSGYLAPEVIMDTARPRQVMPSIHTDRHALATLLYRWFLGYFPLDGDRPPLSLVPDEDARLRFGERALYIEHPLDRSNRRHSQPFTSESLGEEVKDLFREAFVHGLHDPTRRPTPLRWAEAFAQAYDRVIPCDSPQCGWRFFIAQPQHKLECPACATKVTAVRSLPRVYIQPHARTTDPNSYQTDVTRQHWVAGWPGRTLHDWHMLGNVSPLHEAGRDPDRTPRAVFTYDTNSDTWCITNQTQRRMSFQRRGASPDIWEPWNPGVELLLHDGIRLQFGNTPEYNRGLVNVIRLR